MFQTKSEAERLKIAYKKISTHPAHRNVEFVFPDLASFSTIRLGSGSAQVVGDHLTEMLMVESSNPTGCWGYFKILLSSNTGGEQLPNFILWI